MTNSEITQKVIAEKLIGNREKTDMASGRLDEATSELDKAYFYLNKIIEKQNITSVRPVVSKRKGIIAKGVIVAKKIMRKLLFWYIEPICKQQTQYNEMCTQYCIQLFYYTKKQDEKYHIVEEERNEREQLKEKIEQMTIEYQQKMEEYQEENAALKNLLTCISQETRALINDVQTMKHENVGDIKNEDDFWNKLTVAQAGEDSIVEYILRVLGITPTNEQYLDLGANHAKQLSNTYVLYTRGMRGVLVEANPQLIGELKFFRTEDTILNKCVADTSGEFIKFYIMSGDGLSCTSIEATQEMISKNPQLYIEDEVIVETITVNDILKKYFTKAPILLSIDIEGQEENILNAIDYEKYAPLIIIVERIEYGTNIATSKRQDRIEEIMTKNGYFEYAFTGINSIFINRKKMEEIQNENSI